MYKSYYFERITQSISYPLHSFSTTSPRKVLIGINGFLALCSICITGLAVFLCQLLYTPQFTGGYINWAGMAAVGVFLTLTAIIGIRGGHTVSLDLLLTYFWGIIIFILPLILALFACVNQFKYVRIWFKHSWQLSSFDPLRKIFCQPDITWNNKCIAPTYRPPSANFSATNFTDISFNVTSWCFDNYNATDCASIRDLAQQRATLWGLNIIISQTVVGIIEVLIIIWSIYITVQILTAPVITQSMFDVINFLLVFPIAGCLLLAYNYWYLRNVEIEENWFPVMFLALAVAQICALPMGIVSGRLKSRPLLQLYIFLMILIICSFAAMAGILFNLAKVVLINFRPPQDLLFDLACQKGLPGCSGCSQNPPTCYEWSRQDILSIMSLDFRLAGMVAAVAIFYILGSLIVASLVDNSIKNYKTDFI